LIYFDNPTKLFSGLYLVKFFKHLLTYSKYSKYLFYNAKYVFIKIFVKRKRIRNCNVRFFYCFIFVLFNFKAVQLLCYISRPRSNEDYRLTYLYYHWKFACTAHIYTLRTYLVMCLHLRSD